jgi:hypothetical protein
MLTASDLADVLSLQIALGDRPNLYRSISIRRRGGVSLYITTAWLLKQARVINSTRH